MKKLALLPVLFCTAIFQAQVGINTITPATGAILDVYSTDKGLLLPRVSLTGTLDNTTVTPSATTGLLVYNTNTTGGSTGVYPGFYYRLGSEWMRLLDHDRFWSIEGNSNVDSGDFLGSTNNRNVDFRTNNVTRLQFPGNAAQVFAMADGTSAGPIYTWNSDDEMGMWRAGDDYLAFGVNRTEFISIKENSTDEIVFNESDLEIDTRFKTTGEDYMLYVDSSNNRIGVNTNNPQTTLNLENGSTMRVDELNYTNNPYYISNDPMPVYVNTDGDLQLQPSLVQNFFGVNAVDFCPGVSFNASGLGGHQNGGTLTDVLYTTTLNLTQAAVVHINYQISVQISYNSEGLDSPVVDGAPRQYTTWVEVNGNSVQLAYDSDMYTNINNDTSGQRTYAAGYYYLSAMGSIQLPAGSHNLELIGQTSSGDGQSYIVKFGETQHDRFIAIVQR